MTKLKGFLKLAQSLKKRLFLLLLAFVTALLCLARSPVLAKVPNANAIATYQQVDESEESTRHLLNQAQNFQASGHYRNACRTLLEALEIADRDCQTLISDALSSQDFASFFQNLPFSPLKVTGLRMLGDVMRMVGAINTSEKMLDLSLKMAADSELSAVHLSLGNTKRALGKRRDYFDGESAGKIYYENALEEYKQAIATSDSDSIRLRAKLSQLNLLIEKKPLENISYLWREVKDEVDNLPNNLEAVYARMDLAQSLTCLKLQGMEKAERNLLRSPEPPIAKFCHSTVKIETPEWQEIARLLTIAERQAKELGDERSQAYALGYLGELYEITQQWSDAKKLTERALNIAQSKQAWDIAYRWQWQLGRAIVKMGGKREEAIVAYTEAFKTLQSLRSDLAELNRDVQFNFRDEVEPVYRELVDLLLQPAAPKEEHLKLARDVIEGLQLAELDDFFKDACAKAQPQQIDKIVDKYDPKAAFIYAIILESRIGVIFKLPDRPLEYRQTLISKDSVETTLKELRQYLGSSGAVTPEVIDRSGKVYNWLIEPFEPFLEDNNTVETLVFVLDRPLQNIPMAVLYDQKRDRYLIEKNYAIALAPGLQLLDPQPLQQVQKQLKVFTGGVGIEQTIGKLEFPKIEKLEEELNEIQKFLPASQPLLNSDFTKASLQEKLSSDNFSIVHIKTHGQFSSDPEQTFIVAYQSLIKSKDLDNLVENESQKEERIVELLVLSACETAKSDNRATLGLAGIAVRAGARSTLSTLWIAQDAPTTELMKQFYEELSKPNATRAKALHIAQKALFERYQNPNLWATYVLVGNWL